MWSDISSLHTVNRVQHSSNFFYKCVSNIPMISQIMIPTRSEDIGDVTVNKHDYSFYKINTGTQTALKKDTKILSI